MTPKTAVTDSVKKIETSYQTDEVRAKVTGQAVYGVDIQLPGMLYGKILRSPHPYARIRNIDKSVAGNMPGVRAVLTAKELPCSYFGIVIDDELPLADSIVRYIGDEVAAVAATSPDIAERAANSIKVDYEILQPVFEPEEALAPGAPLLHDRCPGNIAWERHLVRANSDVSFKKADLVVERTFTIPQFNAAYLEPVACVAVDDPYQGLTIHTAVQSPDCVREILSRVLDRPISKVRILGPVMGGGFGAKVYGNLKLYILASYLAIHTRKPVKMQLTREEEFTSGRPMIAAKMHLKMAFRHDGTILGREADIITDNGAYSAQAPWVSNTLTERNDSLYRIPAIKTRTRLVYTNKIPTGQYRAYGNQAANFAAESLLDIAAKELGIDPLKLRLTNCVRSGDETVHGLKIGSCHLEECLIRAAEEIGWYNRKPGRGYGIGAAIHASGSLVFDVHMRGASSLARLELDGTVTIFSGEQDYGQGTHATFALIASRALCVPPELITLNTRDTLYSPYSQGALGMRQTTIGGNAVMLAADALREKIVQFGSEISGEPVLMEGGQLRTASGSRIALEDIAREYHRATCGLSLTGEGRYLPPKSEYDESGYGNIAVTYSFAAHAAEVEVDPRTGELTLCRVVAAHDSGEIINYISAEGQVYGGVTQGLGMACMEGYIFEKGRVVNASFGDYKIPTSLDVPQIDAIFIGKADPKGPFGAKGLGEIVQIPVIGAIANAVADATGVRVTDLPITAEKIYLALAGEECK